eukprot:snap_masked-scaffold_39-processed-gene-1.20-mRNA-1 protein AED:1.00 eAED:1.00 QI:0/-1/0/0/-1/1/1/0/60
MNPGFCITLLFTLYEEVKIVVPRQGPRNHLAALTVAVAKHIHVALRITLNEEEVTKKKLM